MTNNSQASNEPKFKAGKSVFKVYMGSEFSCTQVDILKITTLDNGTPFRLYHRDNFGNMGWRDDFDELLTKKQALLAFKEWLGKKY